MESSSRQAMLCHRKEICSRVQEEIKKIPGIESESGNTAARTDWCLHGYFWAFCNLVSPGCMLLYVGSYHPLPSSSCCFLFGGHPL